MIAVPQSIRPKNITYSVLTITTNTFSFTAPGTYDWGGRPSVCVRLDGVWVLVWKESTTHELGGGYWNINFSNDEGVTWTANNTKIGGGAVTGFPYTATAATATQADDAEIICCANGDLLFISHERKVVAAPDDFITHWQTRSTNGGETWTSEFDLGDQLPDIADKRKWWAMYDWELKGTTLYVVGAQYNTSFDDSKVTLWKSEDHGATYTKVSDIFGYGDDPDNPNECGFVHTSDTHILAICRTRNLNKTVRRESSDNGATWGSIIDMSEYFGRIGIHEPRLYKFPGSNRVFIAGRNYASSTLWKNWILFNDSGDFYRWRPVYLDAFVTGSTPDAGYVNILKKTSGSLYCIAYRGQQAGATIYTYGLSLSPI